MRYIARLAILAVAVSASDAMEVAYRRNPSQRPVPEETVVRGEIERLKGVYSQASELLHSGAKSATIQNEIMAEAKSAFNVAVAVLRIEKGNDAGEEPADTPALSNYRAAIFKRNEAEAAFKAFDASEYRRIVGQPFDARKSEAVRLALTEAEKAYEDAVKVLRVSYSIPETPDHKSVGAPQSGAAPVPGEPLLRPPSAVDAASASPAAATNVKRVDSPKSGTGDSRPPSSGDAASASPAAATNVKRVDSPQSGTGESLGRKLISYGLEAGAIVGFLYGLKRIVVDYEKCSAQAEEERGKWCRTVVYLNDSVRSSYRRQ